MELAGCRGIGLCAGLHCRSLPVLPWLMKFPNTPPTEWPTSLTLGHVLGTRNARSRGTDRGGERQRRLDFPAWGKHLVKV